MKEIALARASKAISVWLTQNTADNWTSVVDCVDAVLILEPDSETNALLDEIERMLAD